MIFFPPYKYRSHHFRRLIYNPQRKIEQTDETVKRTADGFIDFHAVDLDSEKRGSKVKGRVSHRERRKP